ncbi:MAG: ABC transporter ATP-binding protein [Treponema sp.]|nr:ABC transporter ATP-binding protein [Treponema sp.]
MKNLLELRGVSAGYAGHSSASRTPVLHNIDLSVEEGELVVLAGPNGSGKTTLLKTAGGLLPPVAGTVTINGRETGSLKPRERAAHAALLFQVRDSPWPFTVRETVAQGRFARHGWMGAETREDREAVTAALEKAELGGLAHRPITEISGGELQRVYVARSIAQGAAFLLFDEPENNLDPKYSYMILALIQTLVREGRGALVSLHDLRLASRFAHRVVLLSASGTARAIGPPAQVLGEEILSEVFDLAPELVRSMVL